MEILGKRNCILYMQDKRVRSFASRTENSGRRTLKFCVFVRDAITKMEILLTLQCVPSEAVLVLN